MAPQVVANVLNLEQHGKLLQLYIEPLLAEDSQSAHGRRAQEAVESGLYGHLWEALETWRRLPHRGRPDALGSRYRLRPRNAPRASRPGPGPLHAARARPHGSRGRPSYAPPVRRLRPKSCPPRAGRARDDRRP
jgi:hypothetical protein